MSSSAGHGVRLRIVIAEDSPTQMEKLRHVLESAGHEVTAGKNGRAALGLIERDRPEMVISDVAMPEMDGYSLCTHIKGNAQLKGIPVMLLTMLDSSADIVKGLQAGADSFVPKPYDAEFLLGQVERLRETFRKDTALETQEGAEAIVASQEHAAAAGRGHVHTYLVSAYESVAFANRQLSNTRNELKKLNTQLEQRIMERTADLKLTNASLVEEVTQRARAEELAIRRGRVLEAINRVMNDCQQCGSEEDFARRCLSTAMDLTASESGLICEAVLPERMKLLAVSGPPFEPPRGSDVREILEAQQEMMHSGIIRAAVADGRPCIINEPASHPDFEVTPAHRPPILNLLVVPMTHGDNARGFVVLANRAGGYAAREMEGVERLSWTVGEALLRRRAEDSMRQSEERLQNVFDGIVDGVVVAHQDTTKFVLCNPAICRMLGYTQEELLVLKVADIHPEDAMVGVRGHFAARLEKTGPVSLLTSVRRKDGSTFAAETAASPIVLGAARHLLSIFRDVTERYDAEKSIRESEERYRALFEQSRDAISLVSPDGHLLEANQAYLDLFGYSREDIGEIRVVDHYADPEGRTSFLAWMASQDVIVDDEVRLRKKDGTAMDCLRTVVKRRAEDGSLIGFQTVTRDITERKEEQEEIRRLLRQNQMVLKSAGEGICGMDLEGKTSFVNPAAARMLGYEPEELIGQFQHELTHHSHVDGTPFPKEQCPLHLVLRDGIPRIEDDDVFWRKDGTGFPVRYTGTAIRDDQGQLTGVVVVFSDNTLRNQMQQQMIMNDRLASVAELAAGIAHELNNPLTGVIAFADLLAERTDLPDEARGDVDTVRSEAKRAAGVVKKMLAFARKHEPVKTLTDVNRVINSVLELKAPDLKLQNVVVETRLDPELPEVLADYFQLQQVLINLVSNADDAMTEAHGRGTLTIATGKSARGIRISLADDGPGISPEHVIHIFDPFFTTKAVGKGTGLGLSICHGIIKSHGGTIEVETEPGKGTTFTIELPAGGA